MENDKTVKTKPDGYNTVSPYLVVKDVKQIVDFTKQAFGAKEIECIAMPDGTVMHAEVKIGDSIIMMGAAREESEQTNAMLYVYVEDTDAIYQQALQAGATSVMEPEDQFYGDRNAGVRDVAGNRWWIATHIEDVTSEELQKRAMAMVAEKSQN